MPIRWSISQPQTDEHRVWVQCSHLTVSVSLWVLTLIPLWAFGIVGAIYYVLFATVLYRILVHVDDHRGRITSLVLTIIVLFLNELWNFGFFGLESTLVGFLGIAVFLVPLTALVVALRSYERFSAALVAVYWIWILYDLAWTFALWRLNS